MGGSCEGDINMRNECEFKTKKRTDDAHLSSDCPYSIENLSGYSMSLTSSVACEGNVIGSVSCASDPMMNCGPDSWNRPVVTPNVGFCGVDEGGNTSSLSVLEQLRGSSSEMMRPMFDGGWNNPLSKGGLFFPSGPGGVVHRSLSQFPSDSGFIERAARFSCFGSGNFSDMVNTFAAPESINQLFMCAPVVTGPLSFENGVNMARASVASAECVGQNGSLTRSKSVGRSLDESRQGLGASSNESDEADPKGGNGPEEPSVIEGTGGETCSARTYGVNKRKRAGQNARANRINTVPQKSAEGARPEAEPQLRSEQNPSLCANNKASENTEQKSQGTDTPKDEYIHVRARRGQATNSHSLAERVRREKISERMKFLQDLVPGCSKVTGKAVMLDEIINYVQSLQRQVEFLSMKLATVTPRLDFDVESLITKDIFHPRAGPSSSLGFQPDVNMPYGNLFPSQTAILSTSGNSDDIRRTMSSHLAVVGYKESHTQITNVWDNDLHNVVQMGFGNSSDPTKSQELNDSYQPGPMKSEQ